MAAKFQRQGNAAVVTLYNPPVNAIGHSVRKGLMDALDWIETQTDLTRIVLTGDGRAYAAGADANEFDSDPLEPHLPDVVDRIETCETPWVAAINGVVLGGGCELCLACRVRIAVPQTMIGFPEVTIGVVPGAGGTQRLPRLIGIAKAYDLITSGKPITSDVAFEIGLVDVLAEDPLEIALHLDQGTIDLAHPLSTAPPPAPDNGAKERVHATSQKKQTGQTAPLRALDLISASAELDFDEGCKAERNVFLKLRQGEQAKALRHLFFAERRAKSGNAKSSNPPALDSVAVIGGGTMGSGIAYAFLNAGLKVLILETDDVGVQRAKDNLNRIVEQSTKRGLIDAERAADHVSRFSATSDYSAAKEVDLAIEAAFEDMAVKKQIFQSLEQTLPPDTILATNTSYLNVNEIAASLSDPTRLIGLHFFAPAHIMRLLEVVVGDKTSDKAKSLAAVVARRLGKVPVQSGVCDGFIGNRILARYREAADTILLEGSTPWEIDEAMVDFGYAMGPYEAQDLSGLDIAFANRRRQDATRDPDRRYIQIADRMVELGKLGKKTGAGWYRYPGGGGKVEDPIVADLAIEEARFAKVERRNFSDDEIRERLLLATINEAADILQEGIAQSARDIDLVTVFGYGFPRWRGGLAHYADTVGPSKILQQMEALAKEDPIVWKPSKFIKQCVEQKVSFSEATA